MSFFLKIIQTDRVVRYAVLFIVLGLACNITFRQINDLKSERIVMGSDMEGYYQYLPYVFLKNKEEIRHMHWAKPYEDGRMLNVFTCGVAIMQLPFFLLAHGISTGLGLENTGYGPVYFNSVFLATLVYVLTGLLFLYKFLLRYFSPRRSFWTTFLIFYGTNLFYYTLMSPGMSHAYSFTLFTLYLYYVPRFYEKPGIKSTLLMAFPLALATLIRPTSLVISIYFILYGVTNWKEFRERISFLFGKWYLVLLIALTGFVVFIPQMLYWHYITGRFFFYSYQEEGFTNILSPRIMTVLVGPRNGWFIYTPLVLPALAGLFWLTVKKSLNSIPTLLILIFILYLNASWWRPTFSAAAGYRAMIEYLPLLAVPLGFFSEQAFSSNRKWIRITLVSVFVLFVISNIVFAFKYSSWFWWHEDWSWKTLLRLVKL